MRREVARIETLDEIKALLLIMIQTGVRVSELVGLGVRDIHLGSGAHCRLTGKPERKRATTLDIQPVT